jgi:hypothetical protein
MSEETQLKQVYRPSNSEVLREYEIGIRFTSRGCVVRVGCKEIPFETIENGVKAINDYVTNPYEERIKWEGILK